MKARTRDGLQARLSYAQHHRLLQYIVPASTTYSYTASESLATPNIGHDHPAAMAAQQIQIAETIRAMKLALKRRPDGMSQTTTDMTINTLTSTSQTPRMTMPPLHIPTAAISSNAAPTSPEKAASIPLVEFPIASRSTTPATYARPFPRTLYSSTRTANLSRRLLPTTIKTDTSSPSKMMPLARFSWKGSSVRSRQHTNWSTIRV